MNQDVEAFVVDWLGTRAAESEVLRRAVDQLVTLGCDRSRLAWLLHTLVSASHQQAIDREAAVKIVKTLNLTITDLHTLYGSQVRQMLGRDIDWVGLLSEIVKLHRRLANVAPDVHKRKPLDAHLCRAALVKYVIDNTGQPRDEPLAAMIATVNVLTDPLGQAAARRVPDDYTTEAHIKWRHRTFSDLMDKSRDAVEGVLTEMETSLRY